MTWLIETFVIAAVALFELVILAAFSGALLTWMHILVWGL